MKCLICMAVVLCAASLHVSAQSLMEAARKESERRRQLAERGIEAKVIEVGGREQSSRGGVVSFSPGAGPKTIAPRAEGSKRGPSASSYRNLLQKLEREIFSCEERHRLLLQQAEAEKWSLPRVGRMVRGQGNAGIRERLQKEAAELEVRIRSLRRQRLQTYEAGRKAGYLPGELDGKAVTP